MNRWTRSPRIPARLSRWINFVPSALHHWSQRTRRLHDACLALSRVQRRRPVLLGLEALEDRVLLDAAPTLVSDLRQLRNDAATCAVALVNAVQPSSTNTPTPASVANQWNKTWSVLTTDWNQIRQAVVQVEYAILGTLQQNVEKRLDDLGIRRPTPTPVATTPTTPAPIRTNTLRAGPDPSFSFVEGTGQGNWIASFTDSDGNNDPNQYYASDDWGDGQVSISHMITGSGGSFQVYDVHTYAEEGSYPITITVYDSDGDQFVTTASADVSDAALTPGMPFDIPATAGQLYTNSMIAAFTDANTAAPASDFTAQIAWGDNTTSAGTITSASNGGIEVGGSHTYANPGNYSVTVTLTDDGGSQASLSGTADVAPASGGSGSTLPPVAVPTPCSNDG